MITCNGNHSCPVCKPDEHPPHIRQSPDHVGLKFADTNKKDYYYHVWLNGECINKQCFEALPGKNGFVWVYAYDEHGQLHRCCHDYICTKIVHGDVRVERMDVPTEIRVVQVKAKSAIGDWISIEPLSTSTFGEVERELCRKNKADTRYWTVFVRCAPGRFERVKQDQLIADWISDDGCLNVWMASAI